MKYLLDSHAFLWYFQDSDMLVNDKTLSFHKYIGQARNILLLDIKKGKYYNHE